MLVLITQSKGNLLDDGGLLQLCESCGRKHVERLGVRWPEPHEHSADKKLPNSRWTVRVRVLAGAEGECDHCQPERELSGVEMEQFLGEVLEQRLREI